MNLSEFHDIDNDTLHCAREGVFDDQMSFPAPFVTPAAPLTTIVKRDGRHAPFDKKKIAEGIFKASQSVGSDDRMLAESLAAGVTIYLTKKLQGKPPTVGEVQETVERVLIEMGHVKTALAYTRYRNRRDRIRRFRAGDPRAVAHEWDEVGHGGEGCGLSVFVRTGGETLAGWDREKIVQALLRETSINGPLAALIAVEVEQQIAAAKVTTLTATLVRELVDAKLIEYGLEDDHRRHQRLGVPLYDARQIICASHMDGRRGAGDPAATDRILAERVKKEFALTQVFSQEVADAHLRGDIHLHGLGFVDRLHSAWPSLDFVKRFGAMVPGAEYHSRPPKHLQALLGQWISLNALLENCISEGVTWDTVNVYLAPFLQGREEGDLRQTIYLLLSGMSYRNPAFGAAAVSRGMGVCWDIPAGLGEADAVGPGGELTGRAYADYAHAAQQVAWALMDVYREGEFGGVGPTPTPVVTLSPEFFRSPGHAGFLRQAASVAAEGRPIGFRLRREAGAGRRGIRAWGLRHVVAHEVTINLPAAAYAGGDEEGVCKELDRLVGYAVRAHAQKREFAGRLLALHDGGPWSLLAVQRDGTGYLDLDEMVYRISVLGLNECVQSLTGEELHESEPAVALGLRLLERVKKGCADWGVREDLRFVVGANQNSFVDGRLARLDIQRFPEEARLTVKTDERASEFAYTPGAQFSAAAVMNPVERIRQEGRFHALIEDHAGCAVAFSEADTLRESVASFVEKVYYQTSAGGLWFNGD